MTEAIGYDKDLNASELYLEFRGADENSEIQFELFQNRPNPFADVTKIGFVLPVEGEATFTVFDATGKLILELSDSFKSGYNQIDLDKETLNTIGVLYYQLESGNYIATHKMVILN